jgi:hypothetical protein
VSKLVSVRFEQDSNEAPAKPAAQLALTSTAN